MAKVLKRCPKDAACAGTESKWGKCKHSWVVRYWTPDGKQHETTRDSDGNRWWDDKKLATAFSHQIELDKKKPASTAPAPLSLAAYSKTWLEGLTLSANTLRIYSAAFRLHINPALGDYTLTEVATKREEVTKLLKSLPGPTACSAYAALQAALSEAARAGRVPSNLLGGIRHQNASQGSLVDWVFPTHEQMLALVEAMPEQMRLLVWLLRGCGLRRGEGLAVKGSGFHNHRLRITEQQLMDGDHGPLKSRKPGEIRDIPTPAYVEDAVAGLGDGYLFHIAARTFNSAFRKAADSVDGLEGMRAHDLRHCWISEALAAGLPVTDVARWAGHRNVNVLFQVYSHSIPDSWEQAQEVLNATYAKWSAAA